MQRGLKDAVRRGVAEHARRVVADRGTERPHVSCAHLLETLADAPGSIHPKVKLALESIVKHVVSLDARITALESTPSTNAVDPHAQPPGTPTPRG